MKKIILLIIVTMFGVANTNASTIIIQGQLTNNLSNVGIANHDVYISDSVNYYDSFTTTANGYYYIVITGINPHPNLSYYVSTKDCNNNVYSTIVHSMDSLTTVNFSICDNAPFNCQSSFTMTHQNLLYHFSGSNVNTYPTYYSWSFGDGTFATGQIINHSFQQPVTGAVTYTVTMNTQTIRINDSCFSQTTHIITILANSPVICGIVSAGGENLKNGTVYLYGINNPVATCHLIDSASLDSSGFYYFNHFQGNYTAYLVKAVLPDNSPLSNLFLPSFYDSLFSWIHSPPVYPVTDGTQYDIHLKPLLSNLSGTASVKGNVSQSGSTANELTAISGAEVVLFNQNDQPLVITTTDFLGNYGFSGLSIGNYKVSVEIAGKISNPAFLSLTYGNPDAEHVNFVVTDNTIALAVDDPIDNLNHQMSEVYPNPSKEAAFIDFSFQKSENLNMIIYNQFGQMLSNDALRIASGNQQYRLNVKDLPIGIYTFQMISTQFTTSKKFIKIK